MLSPRSEMDVGGWMMHKETYIFPNHETLISHQDAPTNRTLTNSSLYLYKHTYAHIYISKDTLKGLASFPTTFLIHFSF